MKKALLPLSILFLFAVEILRRYLVMPFPGSQSLNFVGLAWFLERYIFLIRIALLAIVVLQLIPAIKARKFRKLIVSLVFLLIYGAVFYFLNFKIVADRIFKLEKDIVFADSKSNTVSEGKLVTGVVINGEAKAYPIEIMGYHHQLQDVVGGKEVIVTYCTMCRTGRVFDPVVDGEHLNFRLVGMNHYNAIFEDKATKSWWFQATGISVAGKLKGSKMQEISSEQMTLKTWIQLHPDTKILQPDPAFKSKYSGLAGYDEHRPQTNTGLGPLQPNAWVIGIAGATESKAWNWDDLLQCRRIEDAVNNIPVLLVIEKDNASFHVFDRNVDGNELHFTATESQDGFSDSGTGSHWNYSGICTEGALAGKQLKSVQASQEFYHAWMYFHPGTTLVGAADCKKQ